MGDTAVKDNSTILPDSASRLFSVRMHTPVHVLPQVDGFQGRVNKPADTCCSFWVGATLVLLGELHLLDCARVRTFHVSCQNNVLGERTLSSASCCSAFGLRRATVVFSSRANGKRRAGHQV